MAAIDMITAANLGVPTTGDLKPRNCHEAVLGWVLHGQAGAPRQSDQAWRTLRALNNKFGVETAHMPKQLTGPWFGQRIYKDDGARVVRPGPRGTPFPPNTLALGDVVYLGDPDAPHHSMIVSRVENSRAWVRGFNNAGALGGPFMAWDPKEHDILDPDRWDSNGEFMAINGPTQVRRIGYQQVLDNIPDPNPQSAQARERAERARRVDAAVRNSALPRELAEDYLIWDEWAAQG